MTESLVAFESVASTARNPRAARLVAGAVQELLESIATSGGRDSAYLPENFLRHW